MSVLTATDQLWSPPPDLVLPDDVDLSLVLPRVCHFPEYAYSSGLDAVELAASAGLTLDTWQSLVLQLGLGQSATGRWAAFQVALIVARQNGKGSILEALELFWLFLTDEPLIGHSAHEYKTAMEAFRRVLFLITNTDDLRRKVKKVINTNGEEGIELLTGQRLRFMARSKGAGRGFSFHKLIWDEAYALTGEQQDAQLPTLSAMPDPQVWLTSSPPLDPATGAALFRLRRQAEAGAPDLAFLDYGAAGSLDSIQGCEDPKCGHSPGIAQGCALDDRESWKWTNPAYGARISMAAIARERAALSWQGFARERLGIWPPDLSAGFTVITKAQWDALKDPASGSDKVPLVGRPCFAVAVSARGGGGVKASIGLAQKRMDGKRHLELIKSGPGSSWVPSELVRLQQAHDPCAIVIDPGSPAGSLIPDVHEAFTPRGGAKPTFEITPMTSRDVAAAFGMIYDAATGKNEEDRNVRHLGQPEIDTALGGAIKRQVGDGHAWDTRNAAVDISGLDSITKALWGLATKGNEVAAMPWVAYA